MELSHLALDRRAERELSARAVEDANAKLPAAAQRWMNCRRSMEERGMVYRFDEEVC